MMSRQARQLVMAGEEGLGLWKVRLGFRVWVRKWERGAECVERKAAMVAIPRDSLSFETLIRLPVIPR